ncbi:MAG: branched-chain amino acid ABC transporter permease [bacterium]
MGTLKRDYLLLSLLAAFILTLPLWLDDAYYLDVIGKIGIFTILALGLNLVMGYAGQISLGHAAFFGMGAYGSMVFTITAENRLQNWLESFGWVPETLISWAGSFQAFTAEHMVLAALIAALFTGAVALLVGIPTLRLKGHYLAMATLGFGIILEIVFKEEFELTGGTSGSGVPRFELFGKKLSPLGTDYFYLVWITGLVLFLFSIHLVHSRVGRALCAVRDDEMAAASSGVPVMRTKVLIFTVSAMYASIAGSLFAHLQSHVSSPSFGFMESVKLVVMVVVGGMGSIWGSLLGVAVLYSLPQFLTEIEDYEMAVFGLVLIVVLLVSPKGLAGLMDRGAQGLKRLVGGKG